MDTSKGTIILLGGMAAGTTTVAGTLDASAPNGGDGGFIETSAAQVQVADGTQITTATPAGKTGTWLIDPTNFTIAAGSGALTTSGIGAATLSTNLGTTDVTLTTSAAANGGDLGDILVNAPVSWSAHTLTLSAHNNIYINAHLTGSGTASLALLYGQGAVAAGNTADYTIATGATITLAAGQHLSTKLGSDGPLVAYTVITALGAAGSNTGSDLQGMAHDLAGHYALGSDLDASATLHWNADAGFAPVGNNSTPFAGNFTGLGHTLTGLVINRPTTDYVGLFGQTDVGSTVRDVGLVGVHVTGRSELGALVGFNAGTISHASSSGAVQGGVGDYTGGLVGDNGGTISYVSSTGTVTGGGGGYTGGLVGYNEWTGSTLSNSSSTAAVTGSNYVGGLIGQNDGDLTNSYHDTGLVSGVNFVGGLTGYNGGTISLAYSKGAVVGSLYVGGVAGQNNSTISSAYSQASVTGSGDVGGLVGNNAAFIDTTYATGLVTGSGSVGGLVGYNDSGSVEHSYWNRDTTQQAISSGSPDASGLHTAAALTASNYVGWDPAVWAPAGAGYYPELYAVNPVLNAQISAGATRHYGDANPSFTVANRVGGPGTYVFGPVGDALDIGASLTTAASTSSAVGTYAITGPATTTGTGGAVYRLLLSGSASLTVTARPVTVVAADQIQLAGRANPALTYRLTVGSLVNGDGFSGFLATLANLTSGVGNYTITQGNLALSSNYALTFTPGSFTVTAVPIIPQEIRTFAAPLAPVSFGKNLTKVETWRQEDTLNDAGNGPVQTPAGKPANPAEDDAGLKLRFKPLAIPSV